MENPGEDRLTQQTVDVVSAYVANNNVRTEDLANLINTVRSALSNAGATQAAPAKAEAPMSWKKAIKPDYIISFEDGKHYKSMKRHLTRHGLTPQQYREKWAFRRTSPWWPRTTRQRGPKWPSASVLGKRGLRRERRRAGRRRKPLLSSRFDGTRCGGQQA